MEEKIKVLKFGGTSVRDVPRINNCAALIQEEVRLGYKVCVVVSAMGSQTNQLLNLAHQVSKNPSRRELDMLLSTGERVSCSLLAMALEEHGMTAVSLTGSQCGILTDGVHQNAKLSDIKCDRIFQSFSKYQVVVVAGFQGVNPETKEITTLGRGGSDLTAVALAIKLQAKSCLIYTDVDGLMSCDPRIYSQAKVLRMVSWPLAYSLSCRGAQVLHHRSAFLAFKNNLPLKILNSLNPHAEGTLVQGLTMETEKTLFITIKKNQTYIRLESLVNEGQKLLEKILEWFWEQDEIPSFVRLENNTVFAMVRDDLVQSLNFLLEQVSVMAVYKNLQVLSFLGGGYLHNINFLKELRQVTQTPALVYEISESCVSLAIKTKNIEKVLERAHKKFMN